MYDGWLWLSILKIAACPSPMSMIPAFSPGPQITHGASVGSFLRWMRELLYEQCSLHMPEHMPSSTRLGSRPIALRTCSYSSALRPCCSTVSGVIWDMARRLSDRRAAALVAAGKRWYSRGEVVRATNDGGHSRWRSK